MLKKVEKDFDNVYGLEKLDESYSFDKPVLISMIPINFSDRDINGFFTKLVDMMQIRSKNVDSNYTMRDMPFDMISEEFNDSIADKIIKNIPLGDVSATKQFMHNINIFSYCNGNDKAASMLKKIHDYLEQNNYSKEEIEEIMKEVFVIQVVDNYSEKDSYEPVPYATTVVVQDIYDYENGYHVLDFNSDNPFISTMESGGVRYMLYKSFGEKSLSEEEREHVFAMDYAVAPVINTVLSLYMIKAISSSLNGTSKKDISIYSELQQIINKAQEFIKSKNKMPEELTMDEKLELNEVLFEDIKKIFPSNIPCRLLTDDERKYLTEKDETIEILKNSNITDIFYKCNNCMKAINKIKNTYNNHSFGEVLYQKTDNDGEKDITREDEIKLNLGSLERYLEEINKSFDSIKALDNIPQMMKSKLIARIDSSITNMKNIINSEDFQQIMTEVFVKESKTR